MKVQQWIQRLGDVWVEGQLTQINARPNTATAFLVLRDPAADVSLTLTCPPRLLQASAIPLTEGSRVIVHGSPTFYAGRGGVPESYFLACDACKRKQMAKTFTTLSLAK